MKKLIKTVLLIMAVSVLCFMASCDILDALVYIYNARPQNGAPSAEAPENSVAATSVQPESSHVTNEKEPVMFSIATAYEKGYLSQDDLLSVAYYNQGTQDNEVLMGNNFMPKPQDPEALDAKTKNDILKALVDYTGGGYMIIELYLGTYNGCVVIRYMPEVYLIYGVSKKYVMQVGGVNLFYYRNPTRELAVYKIP